MCIESLPWILGAIMPRRHRTKGNVQLASIPEVIERLARDIAVVGGRRKPARSHSTTQLRIPQSHQKLLRTPKRPYSPQVRSATSRLPQLKGEFAKRVSLQEAIDHRKPSFAVAGISKTCARSSKNRLEIHLNSRGGQGTQLRIRQNHRQKSLRTPKPPYRPQARSATSRLPPLKGEFAKRVSLQEAIEHRKPRFAVAGISKTCARSSKNRLEIHLNSRGGHGTQLRIRQNHRQKSLRTPKRPYRPQARSATSRLPPLKGEFAKRVSLQEAIEHRKPRFAVAGISKTCAHSSKNRLAIHLKRMAGTSSLTHHRGRLSLAIRAICCRLHRKCAPRFRTGPSVRPSTGPSNEHRSHPTIPTSDYRETKSPLLRAKPAAELAELGLRRLGTVKEGAIPVSARSKTWPTRLRSQTGVDGHRQRTQHLRLSTFE